MKFFNKIKEIYESLKGLTTIGVATALSSVIGAIFWFSIAAVLGTEQYGQVSYLLAIAIIASKLSLLGSPNTLMVYVAKGVKIQPAIFVSSISSSIIASLVVYFIFLSDLGASIFILGSVLFTLVTYDVLGKKDYKQYAKYIISQKILVVIFSFSLYYLIGFEGVVLGIGISFLPYIIIIIKEIKKSKIDFQILKQRKGFIFNNYLLDVIGAFNGSLDKLIILPLFGFVLLGNYQLAQQFFLILIIIPAMIFQYILPHDSNGNANKNLKKGVIVFSIISAVIGITIAPILIPIFFIEFNESVNLIQIISLAIIPSTIIMTFTSKFLGMGKSKIVLAGSGIFLSIQIPLIFILGDIIGINGVAFSLVIASSIQAIFLILIERFLPKNQSSI
jgi:O-antigen/teichoic acid export membrane protein|tara:strand:+ start:720 stop:1889 length:1170 start_codon:yes stop_codon:yes gene_type:complete